MNVHIMLGNLLLHCIDRNYEDWSDIKPKTNKLHQILISSISTSNILGLYKSIIHVLWNKSDQVEIEFINSKLVIKVQA